MKNYIAHIKSKPPHERRQHAMQIASVITGLLLVVWVTTLGVRFATTTPPQTATTDDPSQLASVAESAALQNGQATLMVASSTMGNYNNSPQQ
ncbi:MAG TPA: hypothetical protein VMR46_03305 [Candidatus Paceibacterota bacterium]|nr:hypothetical protein [Candidatus Paceibacterota bacterium]